MKNLKKILSSVLALALCASMLPTALATEGDTTTDSTTTTTAPAEVWLYRDYDEGGFGWGYDNVLNQGDKFGTWKSSYLGGGIYSKGKSVTSADGLGVQLNTAVSGGTDGAANAALPKAISTGKLYIALDVTVKTDEALDAQDGTGVEGYESGYKPSTTTEESKAEETEWVEGDVEGEVLISSETTDVKGGKKTVEVYEVTTITEDAETGTKTTSKVTKTVTTTPVTVSHQNYIVLNQGYNGNQDTRVYPLYFYTNHSAVADKSGWQGKYSLNLDGGETAKLELVVDLDANVMKYYKNGAYLASVDLADGFEAGVLSFCFTNGIGCLDNLTVLYYPQNVEATTMTMTESGYDFVDNTLDVTFTGNVSTTVGADTTDDTTDDATYSAPYGATLNLEVDNAETTDKVETLADYITVKKADGTAVAVSEVKKGVTKGEYKIALAEELTPGETYTATVGAVSDILGATLSADNVSVSYSIAQPEVLLYRDYEDYTGEKYVVSYNNWTDQENGTKKYGTLGFATSGAFAAKSKAVDGADGKGVQFNINPENTTDKYAGFGSWAATLQNPILDGKLYVGFDIMRKSDADIAAMKEINGAISGEGYISLNNHNMSGIPKDDLSMREYPFKFKTLTGSFDMGTANGSHGTVIAEMNENTTYRAEMIIDVDTKEVSYYIDGEAKGTRAIGPTTNVVDSTKGWGIYNIGLAFNCGIEYFDNFTILHIPSEAKTQTYSLKGVGMDVETNTISVALESDITDGTYSAPYAVSPVTFDTTKLAVTDEDGVALTIKEVKEGTAYGTYVITVEEQLEKNEVYSVTSTEEQTDNLGSVLDNSVAAEAYEYPEVWHDYDFEESAKPSGWINTGGDARVQVDMGKYGKGMAVASGKTAGEKFEAKRMINEGKINISFDYMDDAERTDDEHFSFNNGIDRKYVFYVKPAQFWMGKNNLSQWGDSSKCADFVEENLYHLDLMFDFDNLEYKAYINGKQIATSTLSSANNIQNTYWAFDDTYFFDNFKMAKVLDDSFKIQKTSWNGEYAEVLLSEGASEAAHALTADQFTVVETATGAAATPTAVEVLGRRVIFSGLDNSKDYTITLPEGYSNFLGTALENRVVTIEGVDLTITSVKITTDENGTELTDETKASLKVGDKVYAEVKYVNATGTDKAFTLVGATYAGSRLTDTNYADVTALGSVSEEVTKYIELDVTAVENLEIKAFTVDSLVNLKPLGNIVVK